MYWFVMFTNLRNRGQEISVHAVQFVCYFSIVLQQTRINLSYESRNSFAYEASTVGKAMKSVQAHIKETWFRNSSSTYLLYRQVKVACLVKPRALAYLP